MSDKSSDRPSQYHSQLILSDRPCSLPQALLTRLRTFEGYSAGELRQVDCVLLRCSRSDGLTRAAHRCVLEVGSSFFAQEIARLRRPKSEQGSMKNCLTLDVSCEVLDIILEFLYTREPLHISNKLAVQVYAAAKRFCVNFLVHQLIDYFQHNMDACLEDDNFLDSSKYVSDVVMFIELLDDIRLEEHAKAKLMQQIRNWSTSDPERSEVVRLAGEKLGKTPPPSPHSQDSTTLSPKTAVAIVGYSNYKAMEYLAVSLTSMTVLFSGRGSGAGSTPDWRSVIVNGNLYIPFASKVFVRNGQSNELIREITNFNSSCICGVRVFNGDVLFYTNDGIFLLCGDGMSCTQIGYMTDSMEGGMFVLRRDSSELTIAVPIIRSSEVRSYSFERNATTVTRSARMQSLPDDMTLIGGYGDMLYFLTTRDRPIYYAAFQGDTEVKRYPVVDCYQIKHSRMCDGRLFLVYRVERDVKALYVCGIDLSSDTILFTEACCEWGFEYISGLVPIIGSGRG